MTFYNLQKRYDKNVCFLPKIFCCASGRVWTCVRSFKSLLYREVRFPEPLFFNRFPWDRVYIYIEYRRRFRMQIEGRVFSQTIQDTDFPDPTSWRKTFKLCIRLGGKILKAVDDVINDVTSDVIFHTKKLILNPFLHIKGGKYEGSRFHTHERASSGLSKNRSRFANRPS